MTKGVDKRIDDGLLWWFGHVDRTENDRIAKSVLVVVQWVDRGRDGMIP